MQELQTLYVLEALLARSAASPHRDDFVLKGGVLLAAFGLRRPTKDIDLQASQLSNDEEGVLARIRKIADIDLPDGVVFDSSTVATSAIRDGAEYAGIRVKLIGNLGRARVSIGVDVNFGDPISPPPERIEVPHIVDIGLEPVHLLGYPLAMVLAEKIVTAIDRGETNTRWRDFADIYVIIKRHPIDPDQLAVSLSEVAAHRKVELRTLLPRLEQMSGTAQTKWGLWRSRVRREDELPESFAELLAAVSAFVDPVIGGLAQGKEWNTLRSAWA